MDPASAGEIEAAAAIAGTVGLVYAVVMFVVVAIMIAGMWKIFAKAGKPGWAAIVPIYNLIVLLEIVGKPAWWVVLMFLPGVNFVIAILIYLELAKAFGKGTGFAVGLIVFPVVFFPMLGFGKGQYKGVAAATPQTLAQ